MRRIHVFLVPLAFALLVAVLITLKVTSRSGIKPHFDARTLPFQLEDVIAARIAPNLPFFVADVDLDGNDDLLINEPTRLLWYRLHGSEMSLAGEAAYEREGSTRMVTDANGDGHPDFFVLTRSSEGAMLSCHDWFSPRGPSVPLYTIGPLLPPQEVAEKPWNRISFLGSFTEEKGAHRSVFLGLNPRQSSGIPRALLAYDGVTGRKLWRFEFGPYIWGFAYSDFGANEPRILMTTHAVGTGISYCGTVDTLSYVFCLDPRDGSPLWKKHVAGYGGRSSLVLADINGDGHDEILVARCPRALSLFHPDDSASWTVEALSREGAVLSSVLLQVRAVSIHSANLDKDPFPEILVQGFEGEIVILDHDLTIKRVVSVPPRFAPSWATLFGTCDLIGDGKLEIVCQMDANLVVRDHEGTPIAERNLMFHFDAQFARYDGRSYIVAAKGDSIHVMTLVRTPLMTRLRSHSQRLTFAVLAVATVAVVGGFHLRRYFRRRRDGYLTFDEARNDLLTAMAAFGHGGSSLRVIDRIRLHLKNWERVKSDTAARDELFARLRTTFTETVVPELGHIVMLAHKACVPEEIWGSIMERTELAGQALEAILAAGPGGAVGSREGHIESALGALDDLDRSIAGVRSYLRSIFRTPAKEALERGVARFRDEHGGTKISLSLPPDAPAAAGVFISPVVFDKILEAIFTNSARATEGRADAEIAIDVRWEGSYCTIDIRDNGCGIPREDWERLFERYFTTKEEGGFGLYYAHEMLAKVNGKIFVFDSVAGAGTTMRVVLRKS